MSSSRHWAVLVGINRYPEKPLKGCVADVHLIQQYMLSGSKSVSMQLFTTEIAADLHKDIPSGASEEPLNLHIERPEMMPKGTHNPSGSSVEVLSATHANVVVGIEHVIRNASEGDYVYIHFSGHGTTVPRRPSRLNHRRAEDLALVLYDPNSAFKVKLLRGRDLAQRLKRMVAKGLNVTLVLDCCFSGSAMRSGSIPELTSRTIPYNPLVDDNECNIGDISDPEDISYANYRGLQILPHWMVEPNGYTIFTACGPNEVAKEITINGSQHYGALSYFLTQALTVLRKQSTAISHRSLHNQLRAQFCEHWPQQNPSRFGNTNNTFFADSTPEQDSTFVPIFKRKDNLGLCLLAGLAHGVCVGDQYAIYQPEASESPRHLHTEPVLTMEVARTRAVTSDLRLKSPSRTASQVTTGWKGKALSTFQTQKIPVSMQAGSEYTARWADLMEKTRFCAVSASQDSTSEHPTFFVKGNNNMEFEILDGALQIMESVPRVPIRINDSLKCVARLVDHLATYRNISRIENRTISTSLAKSCRLTLVHADGTDLGLDFVEVNHGDHFTVCIQNLTKEPLYVGLCFLDPLWSITNLVLNDGGGECITILPYQKEELPISAEVPQRLLSRGQAYCDDILKVFITEMPTSFQPLEMTELPEEIDDLDSIKMRNSQTSLFELLSNLMLPTRQPSSGILDEFWTCRSITIRTNYTQTMPRTPPSTQSQQ